MLRNWRFLEAKTLEGMIHELAQDLTAWPDDPAPPPLLRLLARAIRRHVQFIEEWPRALFQCAWNEGAWHEDPGLRACLDGWRRAKEMEPGWCWVRSLRPPALPLDGPLDLVMRAWCVTVLAVSADGGRAISATWDSNSIGLWDLANARRLGQSPDAENGVAAAFTPQGLPLVVVESDGEPLLVDARKWDTFTFQEDDEADAVEAEEVDAGERAGPDAPIRIERAYYGVLACFSPDAGRVATAAASSDRVLVLDIVSEPDIGGSVLTTLPRPPGLHSVCFPPEADRLALGSADGSVRVWSLEGEPGELWQVANAHVGTVLALAYSKCGRRLASGGDDGAIRIWNADAGEEDEPPLLGQAGPVCCLDFSKDGERLASGSRDGTVRVWDLRTRREWAAFVGHEDAVSSVAFLSEDRLISASEDGTIRVWNLRPDRHEPRPADHEQPIGAIAFSEDGAQLATGSDDGTVILWDGVCDDGGLRKSKEMRHPGRVMELAFVPGGGRLVSCAAAGGSKRSRLAWLRMNPPADSHTICVWETKTGRKIDELTAQVAGDELRFPRTAVTSFSPANAGSP